MSRLLFVFALLTTFRFVVERLFFVPTVFVPVYVVLRGVALVVSSWPTLAIFLRSLKIV
jgi:hypothetical protein